MPKNIYDWPGNGHSGLILHIITTHFNPGGDILDHPNQLFNRVRRRKARPALRQNGRDGVAPAPIPPAAPPMKPAADAAPPAQPAAPTECPASPAPAPRRPPGSHALYSQIMRSHDRMGTRHL